MAFVERMRERPKPQTFTQQVVDQLREMILCGDLEEGKQLRQDMLATPCMSAVFPSAKRCARSRPRGW